MINCQVTEEVAALWHSLEVNMQSLEEAAREALSQTQTADNAELTIVLGTDELLQELNSKYLETDAPTDVLSFPAGYLDPETEATYLGDLIISLPQAISQSRASTHSVKDELQLLVVHGVLHLVGYDHAEIHGKADMQNAQDGILKSLGNEIQVTL